jgi:hypothetical protein
MTRSGRSSGHQPAARLDQPLRRRLPLFRGRASEGEEDLCDDATQALHILYRRKNGFRTLHDWAKAGLLEKIAIIKTCAEQKRRRVEGMYHPAMLPDNAIEATITDQPHPDDPESPMIHAVTLEDAPVQFRDYHVPLEEFGFSPDTTADLDCAPYLNHHPTKTLSDLVEMGYDREIVETLRDDGSTSDMEALRFARDDGRSMLGDDRKGMLRKVRYLEEYTFYDLDDDGIAERLKVCRVGETILNIERIDDQPFEVWCSFPMQGRLVGQSFADKTMDIQRVNTVLERLMLDSGYLQIQPGVYLNEDSQNEHTIDDLLTIRPGRIVRHKGDAPVPEQRVDYSATALQIIEFKIRQRESRTGITRLNKGVDDDTLNDTAKGQAQLMSRGQQMERYIIRQFAEGFARLAAKKVRLMRKHGQPFQIRVDGSYRQVDPSQWPEDFEVQVKVGLGSGSKEDRIMGRQMIGQVQAMLKQGGSQIVTDENMFNNATGLGARLRAVTERPVHRGSQGRAGQSDPAAAAAGSQGSGAHGPGPGQAAGDRGAARSRSDEAAATGRTARRHGSVGDHAPASGSGTGRPRAEPASVHRPAADVPGSAQARCNWITRRRSRRCVRAGVWRNEPLCRRPPHSRRQATVCRNSALGR